jgi:hypothetical protein
MKEEKHQAAAHADHVQDGSLALDLGYRQGGPEPDRAA